jgi:phosphate:Na+ symporter
VLFGLTTLQQGMGGLAERLHPADLPTVLGAPGAGRLSVALGVLALVSVGLAMTTVMQSSTAAIAVTLSAYYAGAVGLDQACALIIGQNIGTATSSAMAAIGASSTAKRLALAYILFKLSAAVIALALFPITTSFLVRASSTIDGATLLAAYHTAYNLVGVAVLLPVIDAFTRVVERILPERGSPLVSSLDPSALATPIAAVEAVRRTVARALAAACGSLEAALAAANGGQVIQARREAAPARAATDALRQAKEFMLGVNGPPESEEEQRRLTSTLHALDHAVRLAEAAGNGAELGTVKSGPEDARAAQLCTEAMQSAALVGGEVAASPHARDYAAPARSACETPGSPDTSAAFAASSISIEQALVRLESCAKALHELRGTHRSATLSAVANGALTASEAIVRVETVGRLAALAHHAWRSAAHLVGRGAQSGADAQSRLLTPPSEP